MARRLYARSGCDAVPSGRRRCRRTAPNRPGRTNGGRAVRTADYPEKRIVFDALNVRERLVRIISDDDLRRYIL